MVISTLESFVVAGNSFWRCSGKALRLGACLLIVAHRGLFLCTMREAPDVPFRCFVSLHQEHFAASCSGKLEWYQLKPSCQVPWFNQAAVFVSQGKFYGATYEQQEAALEILQDFCRQPSFMADMYANADCDITCSNTFGRD